MNLNEKLDIILITYNRAKVLGETLEKFFAQNSPIKDIEIKIIDNNSFDETENVVKKYQANHQNLKYQKNKYNIGGNGNIVNAFYEANKDYIWVLADNDDYNWDSWNEVEDAINNDVDAIFVSNFDNPTLDIAQQFIQSTFVPGVIYKRNLIDDTVMGNMEFNISNSFPHLALSAKVINENHSTCFVKKNIVIPGNNLKAYDKNIYEKIKANTLDVHPLQKNMDMVKGYANSLWMIKDKKIRNYVATHNKSLGIQNFLTAQVFFWKSHAEKNNYIDTYLSVLAVLPFIYKIKFLINFILSLTIYRLIFIYKQEFFIDDNTKLVSQYKIRLFNTLKTKLFKLTKNL